MSWTTVPSQPQSFLGRMKEVYLVLRGRRHTVEPVVDSGPIIRTHAEIIEFLGSTEPSSVLHALLHNAALPTYYLKPGRKTSDKGEQRLSLYGRLVTQHDMLISGAICLEADTARWTALGPTGRFLYSLLSVDWPSDSTEDLLAYVENTVRVTRVQEGLAGRGGEG